MANKTCGHCQFQVPFSAMVCGHCGAEFVKQEEEINLFERIINGFFSGLLWGVLFGTPLFFFTSEPKAFLYCFAIGFALEFKTTMRTVENTVRRTIL